MNDLLLLSPEIIITVFAFLVLTLEIAWHGDRRSATILPWLAFAGAIAALLASFYITMIGTSMILIYLMGQALLIGPKARQTLSLISGILLAGLGLYFLVRAGIALLSNSP